MRNPSDGETTNSAAERRRATLSHPHRLSAVRCLARADDGLHLADLARDVARREGSAERGPAADAAERIYVNLYHVHLPKLRAAGVVSFDAESKFASTAVDAGSVHDWAATDDHQDVLDALADSAE